MELIGLEILNCFISSTNQAWNLKLSRIIRLSMNEVETKERKVRDYWANYRKAESTLKSGKSLTTQKDLEVKQIIANAVKRGHELFNILLLDGNKTYTKSLSLKERDALRQRAKTAYKEFQSMPESLRAKLHNPKSLNLWQIITDMRSQPKGIKSRNEFTKVEEIPHSEDDYQEIVEPVNEPNEESESKQEEPVPKESDRFYYLY